MYFFHHAIFLELLKGSQLYFSVSPYHTLHAYQAKCLSNCSALHTNWIFSNMNHLTTPVRATRMLLNLRFQLPHGRDPGTIQSCPGLQRAWKPSPQVAPLLSPQAAAEPVQTGTSSKPWADNNRPWSSKLDGVLQDYGHPSLSTPSFVESD